MVKLLTAAALTLTGILLFPGTAHADKLTQVDETVPEAKINIVEKDNTKVLASTAHFNATGVMPVVDENGRLFYNKIVSPDVLPKVVHDVDVVDTYTFEHDGKIYTNKVVAEKS
ncbi:MAG: hypothetical protein EX271_13615 [Acidimicrobiales bacterium]|nr:hypothetical protein [Hyphomonadaceae bacterium]RZV34410.1 MAG: hypothetical protein EX271_13615 [Acidimicrobiales bacterium]